MLLNDGHPGRRALSLGALTRRPHGRRARDLDYAVIGVRATGPEPAPDVGVCEIAVLRMRADGVVAREFSTLVEPSVSVAWRGMNGIGPSDVIGAPKAAEIVPDLAELFAGAVVAGHGLAMTARFLDTDFLPAHLPRGLPGLCTLRTLRSQVDLDGYSLARASYALNGRWPTARHSALGEARAVARLLAELLQNAPGEFRYVGPQPARPARPGAAGRNSAALGGSFRLKARTSPRGSLPASAARESVAGPLAVWPHRWRPLELDPALCAGAFGPDDRAAAVRDAERRSQGRRALAVGAAVTSALAATGAARALAHRFG
ncbi:DNA polymerase-3 subunit epsilon [Lipingzhangella halophila]|uniref:DNA polymerase-3 subunit epsilon n=1 Tax=Lipingzhangella halophila TaxID=1783352 RepID=A0A7W7W0L1_9ACTN|nr:3'-5' exonuclease [Lipingzhangella halophila]MBB4930027.1 DNA polymerase-3 subunit epsilon [Lipingzhangella halophila]